MKVGQTIGLEIPVGGNPLRALAVGAMQITKGEPYIIALAVRHDDGCPASRASSR